MSSYETEVTKSELEAVYKNGYGSLSADEANHIARMNGLPDNYGRENVYYPPNHPKYKPGK
jgi:hypothetical protein